MNKQKSKAHKGLTLVEVILALAIMGILALAIIPNVNKIIADNQMQTFEQNCKVLASAIEMYKNDHSGNGPTNDSDLDAYIFGGLSDLQDSPKGAVYKSDGECSFTDVNGEEHTKTLV